MVPWSVCMLTFSGITGQGRRNQGSLPYLGESEGDIDEALGVVINEREKKEG